ncbi:hypothetical protein [Nocardia panacis]|uniref:hypothetical protein n=1 Tax=Nocardia panacis TaxID=2340916 RepID=UPI0011C38351|nr:hypothetical protein [Nocardia panacis]
MNDRHLLTSSDAYKAIHSEMSSFFHLNRRFPEDVYRVGGSRTVFMEYETGINPRFWPTLSRLAQINGDENVDFMVVNPAHGSVNVPASWNVYPAFSMPVSASAAEFGDALTEPTPDDDNFWLIGDLSEVIAITGASGLWGCWGEQSSGIMAIRAADTGEFQRWREDIDLHWWGTYGILDIIAPNCRDWRIPHEFLDPFVDNYRWTLQPQALERMAFGKTADPNQK